MSGLFSFDSWIEWIGNVSIGWVFLFILILVVVAVGFWSRSLGGDKRDEAKHE
jgi:hypothetical protein